MFITSSCFFQVFLFRKFKNNSQISGVIKSAENPDKTIDTRLVDDELYRALRYASDEKKTDMTMYVSAINCPKQLAYERMMETKRRFGKLGGNVAYHGYQSFKFAYPCIIAGDIIIILLLFRNGCIPFGLLCGKIRKRFIPGFIDIIFLL